MPAPIPTPVSDSSTPVLSPELEGLRAEIERIRLEDVVPIRVDIPSAVHVALGSVPEILEIRPSIVATFGAAGGALVDRLETVARAVEHANADFLAVSGVDLEPFAKELQEIRTRLVNDAQTLIKRKLLDPHALDHLQGAAGYKERATDVITVARLLKKSWRSIQGKTSITTGDLERAIAAAEGFDTSVARKAQESAGTSPEARLRARAFTLFFRTYEEIRRMVTYLRWREEDYERIAPSLFAGRARKKSDAEPTAATPPVAPPTTPGGPGGSPFVRS